MEVLEHVAVRDQGRRATRRVVVDSATGVLRWIEFEVGAVPRGDLAGSAEGAVADFLQGYAAGVLGIGQPQASLALVAQRTDNHLTHYRYAQRYSGRAVLGGQLTVHVVEVAGGYTVQSANGWLYPNVSAPSAPAYTRSAAETAALAGLGVGRTVSIRDTAALVVPHEDGYRLAYLVNLVDSRQYEMTRYVDAQTGEVFAEAPGVRSHAISASRGGELRAAADSLGPGVVLAPATTGTYKAATGIDWWGVIQNFVVLESSLDVYELRDNSHAGASEIVVRDLGGASVFGTACGPLPSVVGTPVVYYNQVEWPDEPGRKEEVSAVHNLGLTLDYFRNNWQRHGMWNDGAPLTGCVHGSFQRFNASYHPPTRSLRFRQETSVDGPSVAAWDVVTHEFTHGITDAEAGLSNPSELEARAVEEALSDYFGSRHRGTSCVGLGVYQAHGAHGCSRQIYSDSTLQQRLADFTVPPDSSLPCAQSEHCVGVALSSALYQTSLAVGYGAETDHAAYDAIRYYLTPHQYIQDAAAAVLRAAKDRAHAPGATMDISPRLETDFSNRGYWHPPMGLSMSNQYCGTASQVWELAMGNAPGREFTITFLSGSGGINVDGSMGSVTEEIAFGTHSTGQNDPFIFSVQAVTVNSHHSNDGHHHGFRVRSTDVYAAIGWIDYYTTSPPGCPAPFTVTPAAPGLVKIKATYALTGSASEPATQWRWDRSYNGGTYSLWASQQNTQFIAYAGEYTLDWRLSARRVLDSAVDTGYAFTRVCVPYHVATCMPNAPPIAEGMRTPMPVNGEEGSKIHFGSGLWVGLGSSLVDGRVLRFYSFSGSPVPSGSTEWPNLLEQDVVRWVMKDSLGDVAVSSARTRPADGVQLFTIRGDVTVRGSTPSTVTLALAADPDVGDVARNILGFDTETGVAWVDGRDSIFVGYMSLGSSPQDVRVHQFGHAVGAEPEDASSAYRLLADPSRLADGAEDDVRFLLTVRNVPLDHRGRFAAAFAVVLAPSRDSLRALARWATAFPSTLAALGVPGDSTGGGRSIGFGLRQSTAHMDAQLSGGATPALSARAMLQQYGIRELEYSVEDGQEVEVQIKIYASSGRFVRTLVNQHLTGGTYHVEWDLLNERGERVAPGVYVAVMKAGAFQATRKLVVTR